MNISIIGSDGIDTMEYHINDEFLCQGYNSRIFDLNPYFLTERSDKLFSLISSQYIIKKNKVLLKKVLDFNPDLVIVIYRHIHPLFVKGVKENNIKIIHINPDACTTLQHQQIFVEEYDAYFTKDIYMRDFMKEKLSLNVFLYNEGFNPRLHVYNCNKKDLEAQLGIDVLSVGSFYPYRNRMLEKLIDNKIELKLYGHKARYFSDKLLPSFQNKPIYGQEKAKILAGSKIVFNNLHFAEVKSVNNKFFEFNGAGAFQLCDYTSRLDELLPIDPKLVSFNNIDEAIDLINFYLKEPDKRHEISDVLKKYFLENYTYKHLVEHVLNHV